MSSIFLILFPCGIHWEIGIEADYYPAVAGFLCMGFLGLKLKKVLSLGVCYWEDEESAFGDEVEEPHEWDS